MPEAAQRFTVPDDLSMVAVWCDGDDQPPIVLFLAGPGPRAEDVTLATAEAQARLVWALEGGFSGEIEAAPAA